LGLGTEFAEQLAQMGINLVLVGRLRVLAQSLEQAYGVQVRIITADLSDTRSFTEIQQQTNDLDIGLLVNNAGYSKTGELLLSNIEDESKMFRVNCEAPLKLAMEFGKKMVIKGTGGIIFVSSSVAFAPTPYWTHYSASKAYTLFFRGRFVS
jgi:short-subunit dehydrogenase